MKPGPAISILLIDRSSKRLFLINSAISLGFFFATPAPTIAIFVVK